MTTMGLQSVLKRPEAQAAKAAPEGTGRTAKETAQENEHPAQTAVESAAEDEGGLVSEMMKVDWKASMAFRSLPCTGGHSHVDDDAE